MKKQDFRAPTQEDAHGSLCAPSLRACSISRRGRLTGRKIVALRRVDAITTSWLTWEAQGEEGSIKVWTRERGWQAETQPRASYSHQRSDAGWNVRWTDHQSD